MAWRSLVSLLVSQESALIPEALSPLEAERGRLGGLFPGELGAHSLAAGKSTLLTHTWGEVSLGGKVDAGEYGTESLARTQALERDARSASGVSWWAVSR